MILHKDPFGSCCMKLDADVMKTGWQTQTMRSQAMQMLMSDARADRLLVLHVDDDASSLLLARIALGDAGFDAAISMKTYR